MTFYPSVFERLFFPLNKEVYRLIQETLNGGICGINNFSIIYSYSNLSIKKLVNTEVCRINFNRNIADSTRLFILSFKDKEGVAHTFSVPLKFLTGYKSNEILERKSCIIYSWTLMIDTSVNIIPIKANIKVSNMFVPYQYIGMTHQTWEDRQYHHYSDIKGNQHRPLYQALDGKMGKIIEKKLIIEQAGLEPYKASIIESEEIRKRSYYKNFQNGLNMTFERNDYVKSFISKAS